MTSPNQVPIPGPRGVPLLGNIYDIEPEVPVNSFELLADNYGTDLDHKPGCDLFGSMS
jgi:cytochrome P450/NADPH-cytochrome P450 reductase